VSGAAGRLDQFLNDWYGESAGTMTVCGSTAISASGV
jgi:hypothetical protein